MQLKKIKLINWHIFANNTIAIEGNTLITGENACGKSTLMDAIYFVLSGGDKRNFNKAASEGGQRTIETYVRGKIGSENNTFLRPENDIVSYIALEYGDKKNGKPLVLGVAIELFSSEPKPNFFLINDHEIEEGDYLKNKKALTFKEFKAHAQAMRYDFQPLNGSKREIRRAIGRDLFKLEDYNRYFDLLSSAISFKPISEVSTFVNSFLLSQNNISLDSMREEIRSYQEIHRLVLKEQEKMDTLALFIPKAEKYVENLSSIQYLGVLKIEAEIEGYKTDLNVRRMELARLDDESKTLSEQIAQLDKGINSAHVEINLLENDEAYKVLQQKKAKLDAYHKELLELNAKLQTFDNQIAGELKIIKTLGIKSPLAENFKSKDFASLSINLKKYQEDLSSLQESLNSEKAKNNLRIEEDKSSLKDKESELCLLQKGLNNYPEDVNNLLKIVKEAVSKSFPKDREPLIAPFCEFLEINDRKWTNALEGKLASKRFDLIINPKYYEAARNALDQAKNKQRIYLSGLVNVKSLPEGGKAKDGDTLFSKLDIKNDYVRKYASYLLSNTHCVESSSELEHYESAITPEAFSYDGHVLKACDPELYKKPYIGRESIKVRIALLQEEIQALKAEIASIEGKQTEINGKLSCARMSKIDALLETENYWAKIELKQKSIQELKDEIKDDEKQKGLLEISSKIEKAKKRLSEFGLLKRQKEDKRDRLSESKGRVIGSIENLEKAIEDSASRFQSEKKRVDEEKYQQLLPKYLNHLKHLNVEKINADYENAFRSNVVSKPDLEAKMSVYSSNYKPSLVAIIDNIKDYINEYYELKNRDIVQYEREANDAYKRAENSFRQDFISKLNEKIQEAKKKLANINKSLAKHPFGNDEEVYEFSYGPTKDNEFCEYYRIINSGKLLEADDLFTEVLDEKDASFIKDLFDEISMEVDSSEAEKELERYLDYRNYMNYDIKITNKRGDVTYFSKISREKSGGETQTPFYIVIASCFDELMNKDRNKVESTCQVVFDEAFNNMDEGRIKSLMEFYKNLNIQIIIVVPSNRFSVISPYVETIIGIVKYNNIPIIQRMAKEDE